MRMTNKIMQNNSLYNINNNKVAQDKLSTMMATQKKITKPSDDPVIAIRALRLRTSVSEMTQFYEKNAPDADSWLDVTAQALKTVNDVLTNMSKLANKGNNKDLGSEDLQVILGQLKSLRDEFYSTGNTDYAGRYIFTGFRTDTTLSFKEDVEKDPRYPDYKIKEPKTILNFDSLNYTNSSTIDGLNKNNYTDGQYDNVEEKQVKNGDIHRLRLSYDKLKDDPNNLPTIKYKDENGAEQTVTVNAAPTGAKTPDDYYRQMLEDNENNVNSVYFIPETGELLFSDAAYDDLSNKITEETQLDVTYEKNSWKEGDLRPEHYFECTKTALKEDKTEETIKYNEKRLPTDQKIEYDVGYNQRIQVNTMASDVFTHGLDRDIDDLERALNKLSDMDATRQDLDKVLKSMSEDNEDYNKVRLQYEAADKAYTYMRENVHKMFGSAITKTQGYLNDTNEAVTENGTRSQRLDLISNRLMDQRSNFQTLKSENEDIDIAEVVIQLNSTELTYNSALMATGKIMQTSLMNYI